MKKLFGGLKLNWLMLVIGAITLGVVVGLLNCVPSLLDTSFRDPAIYFSFWILCGIFIIMNSKNNLDSGLKCFVFFLISQPLIYLVEVPFVSLGWGVFNYYKNWIVWTLLCFPMGYLGHYMKKDKWWGLLMLVPMMILITFESTGHLGGVIYSFPHHLLSYIYCLWALICYPLVIFNNKKVKTIGLIIGIFLIISGGVMTYLDKNTRVYETDILCDSQEHPVAKDYKVSIKDKEYGELSIVKQGTVDTEIFYCVHAKFIKAGKTEVILESPDGESKTYELEIKKNTYDIEEKQKK